GAEIDGPIWALLAAVGVVIGNTIVTWLLSLNGDDSYYAALQMRLARDRGLVDDATTPGLLCIQVDGLSAPVLREAVRAGRMPFVGALLRDSHRLLEWRCRVPSMTSASQAGILLGSSDDIPAFRWYEKVPGRLVVSNHPADAAGMEARLAGRGVELLVGGTSVSNVFAGGAARSVLTASTLEVGPGLLVSSRASSEFYGYLVDPYSLIRGLVMTAGMIVLEWYQARREVMRDVRPRMFRGGSFPILRAVSSIFLRDLASSAVLEDLARGAPAIYVDFLNYDEIAHHAAPERGEAMRELESVDRVIRQLVRASEAAARPYRVVLLSDHGQSLGPTFRDRTGVGLDELIAGLMEGHPTVGTAMSDVEGYGRLNTLLTSAIRSRGLTGRAARAALRGRVARPTGGEPGGPTIELGPAVGERAEVGEGAAAAARPEVVVCASGNLALVSFTAIPGRATLEELEARHPGLVTRLATTPGIGFLLVRSEDQGGLVIGPRGIRSLADDTVTGEDPVAPFGAWAADDLRRLDAMSRVGDLVVNSDLDPGTEEVSSFEPLIGCHGGFGGSQTRPFLAIPRDWTPPDGGIVGGEAVNELIRAGMAAERAKAGSAPAA
ncbi:MAG TPA: alkaline phosphatase family protein, partial [Candidatus Limnocylindrales bacterium]|nr:alkaline phosphatase family protein [Candidatus Limnocylindrales bacterium]